MRTEQKANVKNSIGRLCFVLLSILLQISWICILAVWLNEYSTWISMFSSLLALILVLHLCGKHTNAAFKMPWVILLLLFPPLGLCCYLMFGNSQSTQKYRMKFERINKDLSMYVKRSDRAFREVEAADPGMANQMRYIRDFAGYPVYSDTEVEFYADAADGLSAQLDALEQAKHFIFMEYHAIEEAQAFSMLLEVLQRKVAEGVEVRLFYDDVGSIGFINMDFIKRVEACGIQCRAFNPVTPFLNLFMNNRDHRKITVIDGEVGFTGGYNLADEYFNMTHPYGHWKDTGLKLTGGAVRSLTVMFLEMWNGCQRSDRNLTPYFPEVAAPQTKGYVQPYGDSPLNLEYVGENVYMNLIKYAKQRIYITTPYLIISDEMSRELELAAKRGVDVRIITPGIPDKKIIYQATRSYYAQLARQGVRIYEYTPGFLHAKQVLCDRDAAVVGTINMDYRSLCHHFENAVLLYQCDAISDIEADFMELFQKSADVTEAYCHRSKPLRLAQLLLRLFSPLL